MMPEKGPQSTHLAFLSTFSLRSFQKKVYITIIARMFIKNIPVFTRDSKSLIRAKKLGLNTQNYILDPAFFVNDMVAPKVNKETLGLFIMDPYEMVRHSENLYKRESFSTKISSF